MSVMATSGGTRVSHFSNPKVTYSGLTTGTSDANNARSIKNVKLTVSQFRDSVCNGSITVSPGKLTLNKEESDEITVTVTGGDDNPSVGETVKATVNVAGKKIISVSPSSNTANSGGQTTFTITACREKYLLSVSSVNLWFQLFLHSFHLKLACLVEVFWVVDFRNSQDIFGI
jgi:hypothetical protein